MSQLSQRGWKYYREDGEESPYYKRNDGWLAVKFEEDYPHRDISWQVYRPTDDDDSINHNDLWVTARAAMDDIDKRAPLDLVASPTKATPKDGRP